MDESLYIFLSFIKMTILKLIVDIDTMLIGAEGARLLREYGAVETPQAH
jgi:hypothetical protein